MHAFKIGDKVLAVYRNSYTDWAEEWVHVVENKIIGTVISVAKDEYQAYAYIRVDFPGNLYGSPLYIQKEDLKLFYRRKVTYGTD